jgi:hypothetical protein
MTMPDRVPKLRIVSINSGVRVAPNPEGSLEEKPLTRLMANRPTGYDQFHKVAITDSAFGIPAFTSSSLLALIRKWLRLNWPLLIPHQDNGFVGHLTYWGKLGAVISAIYDQSRFGEWHRWHSSMIQPPILAHVFEELKQQTDN